MIMATQLKPRAARDRAESKHTLWRDHIGAWQASGLSQRVWCEREGIALSTLSYWRKRLRETGPQAAGGEVAPPRFIPVSLIGTQPAMTIRVGSAMHIEIGPAIERGLLRDLLSALRADP
jgi:hypothetical protein